jgi:hypothetical protein
LGGVNTLVNYSGVSEAGTWTYYSDVQCLDVSNDPFTRATNRIEYTDDLDETSNNNMKTVDTVFSKEADERGLVILSQLPPAEQFENNLDLGNIIYVYETSGMNMFAVLNRMSDFYMSKVPQLLGRYKTELIVDIEYDIIDNLLINKIDYGKFIMIDFEINFPTGMYNLSIISNSLMKLSVGSREYVVNSTNPQHIVFHKGRKSLELQIQFDWQRINQIAKFIIVQA